MSQEQIFEHAEAAVRANNLEALRAIFNSTEEKPTSATTGKIFVLAAELNKWEQVYEISQMEGDYRADEKALAQVLDYAYTKNKEEEFVWLCQNSKTVPNQKTIEFLLNQAIVSSSKWRWGYIEYLCFLKTDNKPRQALIDMALTEATLHRDWGLALKLVHNGTSEPAIAYALRQAYQQKKFTEFKLVCEPGTTPLSQATLEDLLQTAINDSGPDRWQFISYLCFLNTKNKPKKTFIDEALIEAAIQTQWDFALMLLRMKADNQPGQRSIEALFEAAADNNYLDLMGEICNLPQDRCPRSSSLDKGLIRAAEKGHLNAVSFISETKSDNKPSPQSFANAYIKAASSNKTNILHYLGTQIVVNSQTIDLGLANAAQNASLATIRFLFSAENPTQPTQEGIENAFIQAVSADQLTAMEFFINPENKIVLKYEVIDKAMQAATNNLIIKRLKPILEALKAALPKKETGIAAVDTKIAPVEYNQQAAPIGLDQLKEIRNAVAKAQRFYQEWYEDKDGKKNIRCANGFFSHWWFRHGVNGQNRAKNILSQVNSTNTTEELAKNIINSFLQDSGTAYHRHSFSSFLLDELKKIKDGPWSKTSFNASYHYNQDDVILKLKQGPSLGFGR